MKLPETKKVIALLAAGTALLTAATKFIEEFEKLGKTLKKVEEVQRPSA